MSQMQGVPEQPLLMLHGRWRNIQQVTGNGTILGNVDHLSAPTKEPRDTPSTLVLPPECIFGQPLPNQGTAQSTGGSLGITVSGAKKPTPRFVIRQWILFGRSTPTALLWHTRPLVVGVPHVNTLASLDTPYLWLSNENFE